MGDVAEELVEEVCGWEPVVFVLFQWMYGDKRRAMAKKLAEFREAEAKRKVTPFVTPRSAVTQARLQKVRERMARLA